MYLYVSHIHRHITNTARDAGAGRPPPRPFAPRPRAFFSAACGSLLYPESRCHATPPRRRRRCGTGHPPRRSLSRNRWRTVSRNRRRCGTGRPPPAGATSLGGSSCVGQGIRSLTGRMRARRREPGLLDTYGMICMCVSCIHEIFDTFCADACSASRTWYV